MIYTISDIHGCLQEFDELIDKIEFSKNDELYILGDILDRGPEPISLIQKIMQYPNIYPILGNHEYAALKVLSKLNVEITNESIEQLSADDLLEYMLWMSDGGETTAKQFLKLDIEQRCEIIEYLLDCALYEEIWLDNKHYVLTHAGIKNWSIQHTLESHSPEDFIFGRTDYKTRLFEEENTFLVTGHTPVMALRDDGSCEVYQANGHVAIDCGCVFGNKLCAFCLNTGIATYVDSKQKKG